MAGNFYDKFPAEIREFDYDATDILIGGDAIASVTAVVLGGGISILSSSFSGALIKVMVGGGTAGSVAFAVVTATLTSGQIRQGPLSILIKPLPGA